MDGIVAQWVGVSVNMVVWRHQMETFFASLDLCAGNSPVTGEFPAQRPVTRSFDVFFDLGLNKRFSKQSWGWRFEIPSRSLWRHCNDYVFLLQFSSSEQEWLAVRNRLVWYFTHMRVTVAPISLNVMIYNKSPFFHESLKMFFFSISTTDIQFVAQGNVSRGK